MKLTELKDKQRILILGFGKEGRDTLKFLKKLFPKKVIGIADRLEIKNLRLKIKDKRVRLHLGENYLKSLKNYDIIIKSPGIPIHLPEIERAFREGKITSQTEIFFKNCPGTIIGITGTKGKGTVASLIFKILKEEGLPTYLVGNIGKPALSLLPSAKSDNIYVYELSSHQLYKLKKSPQIAVFLNLYPAHLDFFKNFKEYISAKSNISRYQKKADYLIYNPKDKIVKEIAKKSKAKKIPISTNYQLPKNIRPLIVKFNLQNIMAAIQVAKIFDIKKRNIIRAIKKFKGLPHRLEFVGKFRGIKFYNDSLATIPESSVFAIDVLGKNVQTIILGGSESNVNPQKVAKKVLENKIKNVILFPTTGKKIWKAILKEANGKKVHVPFFVDNMSEAVKIAYENTSRGKICLLSPAYPSFSLFKDYRERGNLFKKYIKKYARQKY